MHCIIIHVIFVDTSADAFMDDMDAKYADDGTVDNRKYDDNTDDYHDRISAINGQHKSSRNN